MKKRIYQKQFLIWVSYIELMQLTANLNDCKSEQPVEDETECGKFLRYEWQRPVCTNASGDTTYTVHGSQLEARDVVTWAKKNHQHSVHVAVWLLITSVDQPGCCYSSLAWKELMQRIAASSYRGWQNDWPDGVAWCNNNSSWWLYLFLQSIQFYSINNYYLWYSKGPGSTMFLREFKRLAIIALTDRPINPLN